MLEKYEMTKEVMDKIKDTECTICLDEYVIGDIICYIPCFHFFHYICLKEWTKKSNKCPLCKEEIKFE